jgi:Fe-S cluster biogenesis protein NfuA
MTQAQTNSLQQAIEKFVNERIQPGIMAHGGDIEIVSFENNVLTLQLVGACVACGIQAFTADAVANYILDSFPELDDVQVLAGG